MKKKTHTVQGKFLSSIIECQARGKTCAVAGCEIKALNQSDYCYLHCETKQDQPKEHEGPGIDYLHGLSLGRRWIYFVLAQGSGIVKIGQAKDVERRMAGLAIGNPLELVELCSVEAHHSLEKALHKHFAKSRARGEWFYLTDEMIDLMEQIQKRGEAGAWEAISAKCN